MVSIDRISNLPDSLLHCIMSFLESQEVVQTCVLSKRWKNLWASLPCLHLDLSKFVTDENIIEQFTKFVNSLLLVRDTSDLHTFRLICRDDYGDVCHSTVTTWILYAIKRNPKVIEINVPGYDYERLPQCIFISQTLEELNLCISSIDENAGSRAINLPKVKKLELSVDSDDTYSDHILNKFALGCPALEDLYLNKCMIDISVVSFPKLKYLNISLEEEGLMVESIRAPNLLSLVLDGCGELYKETSLEKMPSLMNATISLQDRFRFDVEKCNLLRAVANVQNLELSGWAIQDLFEIELPRCPTFFNLTTLSLRHFCMICLSSEISDFLKHTPNLKRLTLCEDSDKKVLKFSYIIFSLVRKKCCLFIRCNVSTLPRCPTFFNLTTLSLRHFCMICHSNEIGDFLKQTPDLKWCTLVRDRDKKVQHECDLDVDYGSNLIKSALFQCNNLDEIEVELKCINVRTTKQLVNTLVESLAELKTTRLVLSFHCTWSTSPSLTELHQFCLSMVQGKHVLTLLRGNKFVVWSK